MANERSFPFDAGEGYGVGELDWSRMAKRFLSTGVISGEGNNLEVYADGSGMLVKVRTGHGWVRGHYYINDAEQTLAIAAAHATLGRIDRAILRVDYAANTVRVVILQGTPNAVPVAPALTTTDLTYEFLLANIQVDAAVGVITAGKVTDQRTYATVNLHASSHSPGGTDALTFSDFIRSGTLGARPAAASLPAGILYLATDDNGGTLYRNTGAAWVAAGAAAGFTIDYIQVAMWADVYNNTVG